MDKIRFIFFEGLKLLTLVLFALLAAKAAEGLGRPGPEGDARRLRWVKGALYSAILILVILGARYIGYDVAAENYMLASEESLSQSQVAKAYANALRAVELRPAIFLYWRNLALNKMTVGQYASLLNDLPAFQSLTQGELDEEEVYRFAVCYYFTGQYDRVIFLTRQLIGKNPSFAAPYILEGLAYTAQNKLPDAERSYVTVLRMYPSHQAAVEGLAHVYFLEGNRAAAMEALNDTAKIPFPPETRKRFEALKALYAQ